MSQIETPVLFLVFNRPSQTKRVFEAIRRARPRHLYVAADGPRPHKAGEIELCEEVRAVASAVDWPCKVETLFRTENLGCGVAVSSAITWFFQHVEEGIILEDDCLPHPDFFPFCTTLLRRYRDDPRVATIAGTHCLPPELPHLRSHYLSKYFQMWGWATWRRTWENYDYELKGLPEDGWNAVVTQQHPIPVEAGFWMEVLKKLRAEGIDTWDYQVFFSCWRHGGNHVMPGRNLISNLGYGPDATHTAFASPMSNLPITSVVLDDREVPMTPDPMIDNLIFYIRFLDSLTHTWWIEQVLAPDQRLSESRTELARIERKMRISEAERAAQRRQLRAATNALAQAHMVLGSRRSMLRRLLALTSSIGSLDTNGGGAKTSARSAESRFAHVDASSPKPAKHDQP